MCDERMIDNFRKEQQRHRELRAAELNSMRRTNKHLFVLLWFGCVVLAIALIVNVMVVISICTS